MKKKIVAAIPKFTFLDRAMCDLVSGRLDRASQRILYLIISSDSALQAKLKRIEELYVEDEKEDYDSIVGKIPKDLFNENIDFFDRIKHLFIEDMSQPEYLELKESVTIRDIDALLLEGDSEEFKTLIDLLKSFLINRD